MITLGGNSINKLPNIIADSSDAMDDREAVERARQGDTYAFEYLINKYKNFVRGKARPYFLNGAEYDDLLQEGMIGLYKAIRDFNGDKYTSFRSFAELCVNRQLITAIKTANRQKHIFLNSYVSLNKPMYDESGDRTLFDIITADSSADPENLIIHQEEFDEIQDRIGQLLSSFEWRVLHAHLEGKTYQEIAGEFECKSAKSVDNALQRVKRKLEKYMNSKRKP